MSVIVKLIVGEFELVERDGLLHPGGTGRWGVRVDTYPGWGDRVGFTGDHPAGSVGVKNR